MKKTVLVLVLASVLAGGVFAQNGGLFDLKSGPTQQKGVLFVDLGYTIEYLRLGGFGIGAGWEQQINKNWTWVANAGFGTYKEDYVFFEISTLDFSLEANARFYIFGTALDKLFINAGLGFGYFSWKIEDESKAWGALNIPLYAGWKFVIAPGFVAEIDIGYRVGIGIIEPDSTGSSLVTGPDYGGLITGIRLGWAF
ncbi:hypothetical protein AGMMS50267_03780 [Spirochaetia bacterium]|nr:hypothetical protein AGMMS50267_03780 [Spirochaetia bacterium]